MLYALLAVAGLTPGIATVWHLRRQGHGWLLAVLAGVGVTVSLPFLLLSTLVVFPPLGLAVGAAAVLAALTAFDEGRIVFGLVWVHLAVVAFACARWSM